MIARALAFALLALVLAAPASAGGRSVDAREERRLVRHELAIAKVVTA